jgi:hypothetical protein
MEKSPYSRTETKAFSEFMATRFEGAASLSFVLNLRQSKKLIDDDIYLNEAVARSVALHFERAINQKFYGKRFRRFQQKMPLVMSIHQIPYLHLHIQVAVPEHSSPLKVKSFCETFAIRNSWCDPFPYGKKTRSELGAAIYNSRFGADTIIAF